jgi:hypothetical protein
MANIPRRHHQVPRWYLDRFADGRLFVRRRDGRSYRAGPKNVAVEVGAYDIEAADGETSAEVEHLLATIEGKAAAVVNEIDRTGRPPTEGSEARGVLAMFLAFQMTRTTEYRERILFPHQVRDYAAGRPITQELVGEFLEKEYLGFAPSHGEIEGAHFFATLGLDDPTLLTREFAIELMLQNVPVYVDRLLGWRWTIEIDPSRQFFTSDVPVVRWRAPAPHDEYRGFGLDNATEIRFPLDPSKQLVLVKRHRAVTLRVAQHRARRCNADMADGAHLFVIGHPKHRASIERLNFPTRRPVIRFNVGPGYQVNPDGSETKMDGEIMQIWSPRRPPRPRSKR